MNNYFILMYVFNFFGPPRLYVNDIYSSCVLAPKLIFVIRTLNFLQNYFPMQWEI